MPFLEVNSRRILRHAVESEAEKLRPKDNSVTLTNATTGQTLTFSGASTSVGIDYSSQPNDNTTYSVGMAVVNPDSNLSVMSSGPNQYEVFRAGNGGVNFQLQSPNGNRYRFEFRVSNDGQLSIDPVSGEGLGGQD